MHRLLLFLAVVSFISIEGSKTCFDIGDCEDLTDFEGNGTLRNLFWKECENISSSSYWNCYDILVSFNQHVDKDWENDTDIYAIYLYTRNEIYSSVNLDLRSPNTKGQIPSTYFYTDLAISSGLERLSEEDPVNDGVVTSVVWRGTYGPPGKYNVGKITTEPTFLSSSYARSVGYGWASNTVLVMANANGRRVDSISAYTGEKEVLFAPGFDFKVLKVANSSNGWSSLQVVYMYEVNEITNKYSPAQENALLNFLLKQDSQTASQFTHIHQTVLKKMAYRKSMDLLGAPNPNPAPSTWTCDSFWYDMNDGCDCDCGAWDPDCDKTQDAGVLLHCLSGGSPQCLKPSGTCSYLPVPPSWTCDPVHYNSSDGCDCGCGSYDPDCDNTAPDKSILENCQDGIPIGCAADGSCIYAPPIPAGWVCDPQWYSTNDGCDCNCGSPDPDCWDSNSIVMNCPCMDMTCSDTGFCVGTCQDDAGTKILAGTEEELKKHFFPDPVGVDPKSNSNDGLIATIAVLACLNVVMLIVGGVVYKYRNRIRYNPVN